MTQVDLLREAQVDIRRAALFYEDQVEDLGVEFTTEVERSFARLAEHPKIGPPLRRGARKLVLQRFPYLIIYRVEAERVLVLAVGHQHRHPDFWLDRV